MKTIKAEELKKHLDNDNVTLIDVRGPAEYKSECIDGAFLMPVYEISLEKIPSKSKPIVVHCRSGKRSASVCAKLLAMDPALDIYSLEGGIVAWQRAGFDVKKSGKSILPLDQQTQLAVGFLAFTGTILGTFIDHHFYIFPGVIGLGLMFAGITGWCGMAKLLARMPWNQ